MQQPEDIEIIRQVLGGRQASYALLVDRYRHMVFSVALKYAGSREEAEEIAQDAFIKAYRALADYKGAGKFSTWLYTITRTTALSHLRSKKGAVMLMEEEQLHATAETRPVEQIQNQSEKRSQEELLRKAISYLSPTDAQVLTLFYHGEQTIEEIGLVMELNANNVKVRLFRARQKLREVLETHYPSELKYLKEK
jgi:RNA polymerase sigma factor (sigma-70 family)